MLLWLLYFTNSGEASSEADKAIKEIKESDLDRYGKVNWMRINIDFEANQCQKYEIKCVPCIYAGREKVFEYEDGMSYDDMKVGIQHAMDRFLNDAIL